jgi:hypothetical protein
MIQTPDGSIEVMEIEYYGIINANIMQAAFVSKRMGDGI